jgi:hypothetical protein
MPSVEQIEPDRKRGRWPAFNEDDRRRGDAQETIGTGSVFT